MELLRKKTEEEVSRLLDGHREDIHQTMGTAAGVQAFAAAADVAARMYNGALADYQRACDVNDAETQAETGALVIVYKVAMVRIGELLVIRSQAARDVAADAAGGLARSLVEPGTERLAAALTNAVERVNAAMAKPPAGTDTTRTGVAHLPR